MPFRGSRQVIDILKDIASASGVPIVAPILTGFLSAAAKVVQNVEERKNNEDALVEASIAAQSLTEALRDACRNRQRDSASPSMMAQLEAILKLSDQIKSKYDKYQHRRSKLWKDRKAFMDEWSGMIKRLKNILEEARTLSTFVNDAALADIQTKTQSISLLVKELSECINMNSTHDTDGYKFFRQDEFRIEREVSYDPNTMIATIAPFGIHDRVLIRHYPNRNAEFYDSIKRLKNVRRRHEFAELLGYSSCGEPFTILSGPLLTFHGVASRFNGDNWLTSQLAYRYVYQIVSACNYLEDCTPNDLLRIFNSGISIPIFNNDGQVKLDLECLLAKGIIRKRKISTQRKKQWMAALKRWNDKFGCNPRLQLLLQERPQQITSSDAEIVEKMRDEPDLVCGSFTFNIILL